MSRQSFSSRPPTTRNNREETPAASTAMRNSAIPKAQSGAQTMGARQVPHEQIAKRAYEISQSPQRGSEFDNWIRAERELKAR